MPLTLSEHVVKVWDLEKKEEIFSLPPEYASAVFSTDGSRILASSFEEGNKGIRIFDSSSGERIFDFPNDEGSPSYVTSFNRDGTKIVTSEIRGTAKIWDLCALIPEYMAGACD